MPKAKELFTGERYGRLVIVSQAGRNKDNRLQYLCKCDCGNETVVIGKNLLSGNTKSCGCFKRDMGLKANTTHGLSKTHLYKTWASMKDRCTREKSSAYFNYGARGISVCAEWLNSFESFRDWSLANGYSEALSIDRIDPNGNYEPENCRWVNMEVQANNKRTTVFLKFNGETHSLKEWSRIVGLNYFTMQNRYKAGKTVEEILGYSEAVLAKAEELRG